MKGCVLRSRIALALFAIACAMPSFGQMPVPAGTTAVAQGILGPRGLKFGTDGNLYVATSGGPTQDATPNSCAVGGGPWLGNTTGTIVKIDTQGNVTTVATGFASTFNPPTGSALGVADVAFLDGELYAVTSGGGCSHGNPAQPNMLAKVDAATGNWSLVANLSEAAASDPLTNIDPADYQQDGVFYSLIAARGKLYAVEANHGHVWSVTKKGAVEMVTDISALADPWIGPTSLVASEGGLIVGTLGKFPITPGASMLLSLKPGCDTTAACGPGTLHVTGSVSGFTTIVSMAIGPDGLMYLLELSAAPGFPNPGAGKVVRVNGDGTVSDVTTGLSVPTGMTFGPDGYLYVSNWGAAPAPIGQILKIAVN